MIRPYIVAFLAAFILLTGCVHKAPTPPKKEVKIKKLDLSKINYPTEIGNYQLESKKSFKNENLGITLRYIDTKKTKAYLDCYIYPQGNDTNITLHYNELLSALSYMYKVGELEEFKILSEDSVALDQTHPANRAVLKMANHNLPFYSVAYLTPLEDHYFKVRLSNPLKEEFLKSDFGEKTVQELFKAIKFNK